MSDLQQLLGRHKLSIKEFTRQLAPFLEIDWTDSWYQHIYRVVKGEVDQDLEGGGLPWLTPSMPQNRTS